MTLGQKQRLFAKLFSELVTWIYEQNYEVTYGDAYRDPRAFGKMGERRIYGRRFSNHKVRLAHDINLFYKGRWLKTTKAHEFVGIKWESMHELCRWGGHYDDGNHYSFIHQGRQ